MKRITFSFKTYFFVLLVISFISALSSSFIISSSLSQKARYESEYQDNYSFYYENGFDLLVTGASAEQKEDFNAESSISNNTFVSKTSLTVDINGKEDFHDILVVTSPEDLELTAFTSKRIIKQIDVSGDYVYADYKFCELNHISIGEKLRIYVGGIEKECTISRLYRSDHLSNDGILVAFSSLVSSKAKAFSVYLKSNNLDETKNYLKNYKPLGTLLPQTDSQSDSDYQNYLDEFNSKNYSSYIIDLSEEKKLFTESYSSKIASANTNFIISTLVITFLSLLVSLSCFFIFAKNKKDRIYKYIQENGNKKIFRMYSVFNSSLLILTIIGAIVTMAFSLKSATTYYTFGNMFLSSFWVILGPLAAIAIGYVITIIIIKKA